MKIHPLDTVEVDLATGHKIAIKDMKAGDSIIKYGFPIGHATAVIAAGERVHTHNMKTNLKDKLEYSYQPEVPRLSPSSEQLFFKGYLRETGDVGIRNEIWIIPTVGCVNKVAERLARLSGAECFTHPFGCSQLGDDMAVTQKILRGLVNHPNAGGVLVLGLGCENNHITEFKKVLGYYNPDRVKFLNTQDGKDEITEGIRLLDELKSFCAGAKRIAVPLSKLKVGLKCGGSDAFSGITANPVVGRFSDRLVSHGGSTVLTEVPELFGAEHLLMARCKNKEVFQKTVHLINNFKDYFESHHQVIYENPSPGNKEGGITTLEEKSLGCVQKGGSTAVNDVLDYGDTVKNPGLSLLNGPGNDIVAITNLTAAGVHMILFTTGRGTPVGAPVPTIKISSNTALYQKKSSWIDFNAGAILDGTSPEQLDEELFNLCLSVANGKNTKAEENGYKEISIFKDGVTL